MSAAGPPQGAHFPLEGNDAASEAGKPGGAPHPVGQVPLELQGAPLGHPTRHPDTYDGTLLFPVPRGVQRDALGLRGTLPFAGVDLWTAYDLTWLDPRGKPRVAIATLAVPAESPAIVESKSMKLYLGSFAQSAFASASEVRDTIAREVSRAAGAAVDVALRRSRDFAATVSTELDGDSLDAIDVACETFEVDPGLLQVGRGEVRECVRSDLFRSVCPVTGQPDLASVQIEYRGRSIDRASLLRYLVSYRRHPGFHEACIEKVFVDLVARCGPEELTVYARFTRRGGIDINPFRSNVPGRRPLDRPTARQ